MLKKIGIAIVIAIVGFVAAVMLFADDGVASGDSSSSAERVAKTFVENVLAGKGEKAINSVGDYAVAASGLETRKLFEHAFVSTVNDKYSKNSKTKYKKVTVIDSYPVDYEEFQVAGLDVRNVVLEMDYVKEGFFSDTEGEKTTTVTMVKENNEWKVLYFDL